MIRLLEQNLLHAVERLSIERGHDPATFTLVAAGGAGPMHGAAVGRALGCRRVCCRALAGAFCALGMLHVRRAAGVSRASSSADLDKVDRATLDAGLRGSWRRSARDALAATGSAARPSRSCARSTCVTPASNGRSGCRWPADEPSTPASRAGDSNPEHSACSAIIQPGGRIEITALRVVGIGRCRSSSWTPPPRAAAGRAPGRLASAQGLDRRGARLGRDVPIYAAPICCPAAASMVPRVIEEAHHHRLRRRRATAARSTSVGNFLIRFDEGARA